MKLLKTVRLFLVAILIIGLAIPNSTEAATIRSGDLMQINKTVSKNTVVKGETTDVTMTVKGTPKDSTFVKPNDVILIIDKSGSMQTDNRMAAAKTAAKEFIDLMDLTKHELGIVDFDTDVYSFPLTTDKTAAKAYVDTIQLGGSTNTGAAIRKATAMLANKRTEAQPTIVIMTDGAANSAPDALAASKVAKDAGITFYSIALLGPNENPDTSAPNQLLKEMASSFDHHHFVLGSVGLSDVYKAIVEEIGLASAYNVTITDTISPEFELVPGSYDHHIPKPTVTGNKIEWFISELKTKELTFTYQVRAKKDATTGKYPVSTTATTFEMGDGSTYSMNTTNPNVEIKNHAPIITSINEDKGLITGGETVTITGQNFLPGVNVYFGSKLATIVSASGSEIVVTTPSGTQGSVVVKVENSDKQFTTKNFSYYAIPTITAISPAEGPFIGGNSVTINGSYFLRGAVVYFDGVEAATTFSNTGLLRAIAPSANVSGAVTVKVVNPDQSSVELIDGYTYLEKPTPPAVEIISLSAISGELKGGSSVVVTGKNFNSKVQIYFGNIAANTTFISSSSVRVTVPASSTPGFVSVKAENPDGMSAVLSDAYEYLAPPPPPSVEIISLSTTSGELKGGVSVIVTGKNFNSKVQIYFGDTAATTVFISSTSVRATVPATTVPGIVSVKAENPDGMSAVLTDAYEYLAPPPPPVPEITSLSEDSILIGKTKNTIVYGKNFVASSKVFIGDQQASTTFLDSKTLRVAIPISNVPGTVDVKVQNVEGQTAVLTDAFTYTEPVPDPAPIITSLSSDTGSIAGNEVITITGDNFKSGLKVYFGDIAAIVTSISATEIKLKTPSSQVTGIVSVKVVNADQQEFTLQDAYKYEGIKPTITHLSLDNGALKGGYNTIVYGTNFNKNVKVTVDGKPASVTFLSTTQLRVAIPAGTTSGVVDIVVNLNGETATIQFRYN